MYDVRFSDPPFSDPRHRNPSQRTQVPPAGVLPSSYSKIERDARGVELALHPAPRYSPPKLRGRFTCGLAFFGGGRMGHDRTINRSRRRWVRAAWSGCGALAAVGLLAGLGEAYTRLFPPRDSFLFLGEDSPLRGPYVPADDFGVAYRSWQAFCDDNPRLQPYLPLDSPGDPRPLWAMFGNSFVQAPRMLADTARVRTPERRVFNLGRNEPLCVRLAQIRLLLDHGLKPERVIVGLMPLDAGGLGRDPLASQHVTARGALTCQPRLPDGAAGWLVEHSALVRTAWFRTDLHHAHPDFRANQLNYGVGEGLLADLDRLFGALARTAADHQTPITVVLIPNYEQITCGAPRGFQEALTPILQRRGIDVCDPCEAFRGSPNQAALFIPDKHFSDAGNRILLAELLRHLAAVGAPAPAEVDPS
jgi:hypothetical protein